jgi:hypothetical protein
VNWDDQAAPLPAAPRPSNGVNTNDDWLLKPPSMPRTFDSEPAASEGSTSLASDATSRTGDSADDAWWTRDTQRLQGLTQSAPEDPRKPIPPLDVWTEPSAKILHPSASNSRLTVPIELDAARAGAPTLSARNVAQPPLVATRSHLIADGDTLDRLAERYLQDPARAREIFELNQDVLRDPNLLPIGKPLRIPGEAGRSESEPDLEDSTGRMVPVEGPPRTAVIQPQAQLKLPEPIALRDW